MFNTTDGLNFYRTPSPNRDAHIGKTTDSTETSEQPFKLNLIKTAKVAASLISEHNAKEEKMQVFVLALYY